LLESLCAELFDHDHVVTLRTWLHGLPPQVLESSPRLAFWLAWAQVRTGRWPGANQSLRIAEEAWTANDDRQGEGMVLLWHAVRLVNAQDSRRAIEFAQRALDCLQSDRPTERIIALLIRGIAHIFHGEPIAAEAVFADARTTVDTTGRTWLQPFEMAYSAALMAQQGKLLESTVLCRQAIKAGGDQPTEIWAQVAHFLLGQVYLEWGLLDDARRCFLRAENLAEMTQSLHWRDRIRVGLARVAWTRGATEDAFDQIEQAINFAANAGLMQDMRNARAHQARFWLASNDLALARRWADSSELDPYLPPEYERQVELLTFARLLVQEGRADLALRILQRIDKQAVAFGRYGERVEIQIVTALAHKALGASVEAFTSLNSALKLGEAGGYVRIFVDEGEALASLLRHAAARAGQRDYVQRLLAEFGRTEVVGQPNQSASQDGLSDREVEVLRLVAAGLANRDVGRRLFISEKTVKTHMSNIMGKLGATNRTQAVDQARRLSLL
jgi:LuxR family maltose regulon positive regulatory protein